MENFIFCVVKILFFIYVLVTDYFSVNVFCYSLFKFLYWIIINKNITWFINSHSQKYTPMPCKLLQKEAATSHYWELLGTIYFISLQQIILWKKYIPLRFICNSTKGICFFINSIYIYPGNEPVYICQCVSKMLTVRSKDQIQSNLIISICSPKVKGIK